MDFLYIYSINAFCLTWWLAIIFLHMSKILEKINKNENIF